jgi:hypothetical protein
LRVKKAIDRFSSLAARGANRVTGIMEPIMTRLNGWQRIGVVASMLWIVLVAAYSFKEISEGPFSAKLVTDVSLGEPDGVWPGRPVIVTLNLMRFCAMVLVPIAALWIGGWAVVWIAKGFRR